MPTNPSIRLDAVDANGTTLECAIEPSRELRRFFSGEPFRAEYDVSIEDVPEGILAIPALAQLCPVAWTRGADVYVDEVDARFAHALADVEATLRGMYPEFIEGGELYARRTVGAEPEDRSGHGLLFTGGVDSTAAYVRRREAAPTPIAVRGWTIGPEPADDGKWATLRERVSAFAAERGLEAAFVAANPLEALDHPMLLAHFSRHVDGGWYSSVGHGLGLLGLCAPLAYARGMGELSIAATHWEGVDLEWGSRPEIDERVRWTGTDCRHEVYDLTRQERLDLIADYVRTDAPGLALQTCNVRLDGNCSECEKCYRTSIGLRLAGLDPNDHGYRFEDADYRIVREAFEDGSWILGEDERLMWADIRERVRETEPRSAPERAFFEWLESVDLGGLVGAAGRPLGHRLLQAGARNAPTPVYRGLYPVWDVAKRSYRRVSSGR